MKRNNFVYIKRNNHGYTLVEILIALAFLSIIISVSPILIKQLSIVYNHQLAMEYEVSNFFIQLNRDAREASKAEVVNNQLFLSIYGDTISYEIKNNRINRKVNNQGNNFGLLNVGTVKFTNHDTYILVEVWSKERKYFYTQLFRSAK